MVFLGESRGNSPSLVLLLSIVSLASPSVFLGKQEGIKPSLPLVHVTNITQFGTISYTEVQQKISLDPPDRTLHQLRVA